VYGLYELSDKEIGIVEGKGEMIEIEIKNSVLYKILNQF